MMITSTCMMIHDTFGQWEIGGKPLGNLHRKFTETSKKKLPHGDPEFPMCSVQLHAGNYTVPKQIIFFGTKKCWRQKCVKYILGSIFFSGSKEF